MWWLLASNVVDGGIPVISLIANQLRTAVKLAMDSHSVTLQHASYRAIRQLGFAYVQKGGEHSGSYPDLVNFSKLLR